MGLEAECTARFEGHEAAGKALLEPHVLTFRGGGLRVEVPVPGAKATARRGDLEVVWDGGALVLRLGKAAEAWALKIRYPRSRLDKLGIKAGHRVVLLGVRDAELTAEARDRGARISTRLVDDSDVVLYGVDDPADLLRLADLRDAIAPAGAVWVVRRKGKGARPTESETMAAGKKAGLVDVKVVAFSETHTAEKFVIPVARRDRG